MIFFLKLQYVNVSNYLCCSISYSRPSFEKYYEDYNLLFTYLFLLFIFGCLICFGNLQYIIFKVLIFIIDVSAYF